MGGSVIAIDQIASGDSEVAFDENLASGALTLSTANQCVFSCSAVLTFHLSSSLKTVAQPSSSQLDIHFGQRTVNFSLDREQKANYPSKVCCGYLVKTPVILELSFTENVGVVGYSDDACSIFHYLLHTSQVAVLADKDAPHSAHLTLLAANHERSGALQSLNITASNFVANLLNLSQLGQVDSGAAAAATSSPEWPADVLANFVQPHLEPEMF